MLHNACWQQAANPREQESSASNAKAAAVSAKPGPAAEKTLKEDEEVLPDTQKKPFDFKAWDPSQTRQPETVSLRNAHT